MKVVISFLMVFALSCSHGSKKIPGEDKELLSYLHERDKVKNCSNQKAKAFLRKNQSDYWNQVGVCHFLAGDYEKAVFYFDMSLKRARGRSSAKALNNLGVLNLHFKRYRRAHSFFAKALEKDSQDLLANLNLAHLYMEFKRYHSADKILRKLTGKYAKNQKFQSTKNRLNKMRKSGG